MLFRSRGLGKMGWLAAFVYCAGAALRLARFNTNIAVVDKRFFQGLPSPAAAALVAGFIWLVDDLRIAGADFSWLSWAITVYAGLTMVTNVPFYSFKDVNFKKSVAIFTQTDHAAAEQTFIVPESTITAEIQPQSQIVLSEAKTFLTRLGKDEIFTFQTFGEANKGDRTLSRVSHGNIDQQYSALAQRNARGAGVFVMVNEIGRAHV